LIAALFSLPAFAEIQSAQKIAHKMHFAHKWVEIKCDESECSFNSSFTPPVPFSMSYKTEAIDLPPQL
jgi:hypothetical protein